MIFIMLTRLTGKEVQPSKHSLEELEKRVKEKIKESCQVKWVSNYALLGPYDYLDIFEAPDVETAIKVAALVRAFGSASTEIWPCLQWKDFKKVIAGLPDAKE